MLAIQASTSLPATPFTWTNKPPISSPDLTFISLSQDLLITWSGGNPNDFVTVNGYSVLEGRQAGTGFVCSANNSAGQLTVPAALLSALPATTNPNISAGFLSVINTQNADRFQASGLNLGLISATTNFDDIVLYRAADVVLTGTAESVSGTLTGTDLFDGENTATGSVAISATGSSSSSQTVYTGGGNGGGTVSCVNLTGSNTTGDWIATLSFTFTVTPSVPSLATSGGSLTASGPFSITVDACGQQLLNESGTLTGTGTVSPGGAVTLSVVGGD
jgi:hypothetical protein